MTDLPCPTDTPGLRRLGIGHLGRWAGDPIELLSEGAALGPVFRLRLWRPVVVGYRPAWNRAVLGDLDTFRARGSLSNLTPYLNAGVVRTDVPDHDGRRAAINPHFHNRALTKVADALQHAVETPVGRFDGLDWAGRTVRRMLNAAFFAGRFPDGLLAEFLAPLQGDPPSPMLPRPLLFRRMNTAIARTLEHPAPGTISAALATNRYAVEELRVALAAGYDTTAHTLAWALWHLAGSPQWRRPELLSAVIDETLRLYPAGWIGSRIARRNTQITGVPIPAGTMILYSPYLTHRDPDLWEHPAQFQPQRFGNGIPAWGFIPFSAGRRTCLGAHLARRMLNSALTSFCDGELTRIGGDASIRTSISLRPAGPLHLAHASPPAPPHDSPTPRTPTPPNGRSTEG